MKTTLELRKTDTVFNEKLLIENLNTLENVWNITVNRDLAQISFEYLTWADLELVRKELHELGYRVINDTGRFDNPKNRF